VEVGDHRVGITLHEVMQTFDERRREQGITEAGVSECEGGDRAAHG
jgi:hypothetical protein